MKTIQMAKKYCADDFDTDIQIQNMIDKGYRVHSMQCICARYNKCMQQDYLIVVFEMDAQHIYATEQMDKMRCESLTYTPAKITP